MNGENNILPQMQPSSAPDIAGICNEDGRHGKKSSVPLGERIEFVVEGYQDLNNGSHEEDALSVSCLPCKS